ncbi:MAG: HAD family phosphatase [Proteobacteria bacterium]|nr:HAD family phosphatase [Pseudomonadota bacterium]
MKKIQGILFDCDGVLLDSERNVRKMMHDKLKVEIEMYDFSLKEFINTTRGLDNIQTKQVLETHGFEIPDGLVTDFLTMVLQYYCEYAEKITNVEEMLIALNGYPKAVCSSNWVDVYKKALQKHNLDEHFDVLLGHDDVEKTKPEPHIYLEGGKRLGLSMENCLAIEDTAGIGLQAAKASNAGVVVGFTGSGSLKEDFIEAGADYIIDSLLELPKLVERINAS